VPDQLNGATRLYPIIGDPVTYVESPARLSRTFAQRGHNGLCIPMQVRSEDLGVVMSGLSGTVNVEGVLVTMPHKFAAVTHCATISDRSRMLEVVSVLRRNPDRTWHGDMLDGVAFVKAQVEHGATIEGARALLVGAGGAGRAIALALLEAGLGELLVHDANATRTMSLVELLVQSGERARGGPADPTGCDLVFNATPLGMEEGDPLPVNPVLLTSSMFVGDVVAGHGVTPCVGVARDSGCATAGGDDMVEAGQILMADFMLASEFG
jgi:shikimate dehydrogenase